MPNDEQEIQRLDLTHVLVTKTIGDVLYKAPIDETQPLRILDVGTGTGICMWSRSFNFDVSA
jgi:methylase of polypeptide subunit release factors